MITKMENRKVPRHLIYPINSDILLGSYSYLYFLLEGDECLLRKSKKRAKHGTGMAMSMSYHHTWQLCGRENISTLGFTER